MNMSFLSHAMRDHLARMGVLIDGVGVFGALRLSFLWLTFPIWGCLLAMRSSHRRFVFRGNVYSYLLHNYNLSWANERAVEVPIVWGVVGRYHRRKVLEVGNVLSHYFTVEHDIVDKYEKSHGVINQDAVDITAYGQYELIISISTLEHIGWDEVPKNPMKVVMAVENLKRCLMAGGMMIVTFPVGYNPHLDALVRSGGCNSRNCIV